jgi:hypothetical protein
MRVEFARILRFDLVAFVDQGVVTLRIQIQDNL